MKLTKENNLYFITVEISSISKGKERIVSKKIYTLLISRESALSISKEHNIKIHERRTLSYAYLAK